MRRAAGLGLLLVVALLGSGCAMCCSPYDEAYGFSGGRWPRADLCHGRVGSAFDSAGTVSTFSEGTLVEPLPDAPVPQEPYVPMKSIKKQSSDWSGDLMQE
jgi:hypothetical protein